MTGNTVLLAIAIAQGHETGVLRSGTALIAFVLGATVGAIVVGRDTGDLHWPSAVTRTLALEGFVLCALSIASTGMQPKSLGSLVYAFIGLSALAMGMQTAAVRRLGVAGLSTTVITTTLATVVEGVVVHVRAKTVKSGNPKATTEDQGTDRRVQHLGLQTAVIASYGVAASGTAILESRVVLASFWLPTVIVAAVVIIAWNRYATTSR